MASTKQSGDKPRRKRHSKNGQPDPEWTYTPPPLSARAERFLAWWVEQHPPTPEQGLTVFMHVPILRQILAWLEQPEKIPTQEQSQRVASHEASVHVASHADLLLFGAGKRAERERVFIELVEGCALLAFVPGGVPRLPGICEAHDAQEIASALDTFLANQSDVVSTPQEGEAVAPGSQETDSADFIQLPLFAQ